MKSEDMKKLAVAFFDHLQRDNCEYGGIGVDSKRPFGSSDVEYDILEIIGATMDGDDGDEKCWSYEQRAYAADLYGSLIEYLQAKYGSKN